MSARELKAAATGAPDAAPAGKKKDAFEVLKQQMQGNRGSLKPLLGGHDANVDAFIQVCMNAVTANPELLDADRRSFFVACLKAANDGLMPDGREAVLNIYNTNVAKRGDPADWRKMAQYLPMVAGLVKLMYEIPGVETIDAACAYENDKFRFLRGDRPSLEHEPTMTAEPGPVIAAYCVVGFKGGALKREVMPRRDIDKVRAASKAANSESGPWVKWFDQMAIKSVIKRISKQLPRNERLLKAIDSDNDALDTLAAAGGTGIGEIMGGSAPALGNDPTTGQTFDAPAGREGVPVGGADQAAEKAGQQRSETGGGGPSLADLKQSITNSTSAETGMLALDLGRDLTPEQQKELRAVFDAKYPDAQ